MSEYTYDIVLQTEIGTRKGKLILNIERNILNGILELLGYSVPCSGIVKSDGSSILRGQLKTFMSTYEYIGTGLIDSCRVDLVLKSGKKRFHMFGTTVK